MVVIAGATASQDGLEQRLTAAPEPRRPAFAVPAPAPAAVAGAEWAPVRAAAPIRIGPDRAAAPIARLPRRTPEGTTNVVQITDRRRSSTGAWVKVVVPGVPNSISGWVSRRALGSPRPVRTELIVDRARRRAILTRGGRPVFVAPVAVGAPDSPTPPGRFYIRNRLASFASAFYGPLAFGTSARSAVLTDWPGGGFIGIHGTNRPSLIPGAVSHGCIRLRNPDIRRLGRLMPVGTTVTIL